MKKQGKQFEWKDLRELFKQAVHSENGYGRYSALLLADGHSVIWDRVNFKFLLPSSGPLYTLPDDWKQWMKRGFIVVAFHRASRYFEYYIFSAQDKRFIVKGKKVKADAFLKGVSDYFIVKNDDSKKPIFNSKEAIFNKNGQQISDWFDEIISNGLVEGKSDYYIVRFSRKFAIFHKDGQQISDWHDWISIGGLVYGESNYYVAERNGKKAIFDKNGKQISDWFDGIYANGLIWGQSEYYMAEINKLLYVCKLGSRKIIGPFKSIFNYGFIEDLSKSRIIVITSTNQYVILTKQEVEDYFKEREVENEK
jgi:hypothetical protein